MLASLWIIWSVGVLIMVTGVALVSARRPRRHYVWGLVLFALGFVVALSTISTIIVAPVR